MPFHSSMSQGNDLLRQFFMGMVPSFAPPKEAELKARIGKLNRLPGMSIQEGLGFQTNKPSVFTPEFNGSGFAPWMFNGGGSYPSGPAGGGGIGGGNDGSDGSDGGSGPSGPAPGGGNPDPPEDPPEEGSSSSDGGSGSDSSSGDETSTIDPSDSDGGSTSGIT